MGLIPDCPSHETGVPGARWRGNAVASSGTLAGPFGFLGGQGYQEDADSGLMRLGARYYDPSVGRFISRDPLRYGDGQSLRLRKE